MPPEEVARRELSEEIGGTAADLRYIGQFYTSNGISNEVAYVYLAAGVELGESHPEPTELMEIHLVPVQEAVRMAREGAIADGPSTLARQWCEPLLPFERTISLLSRTDLDPGGVVAYNGLKKKWRREDHEPTDRSDPKQLPQLRRACPR